MILQQLDKENMIVDWIDFYEETLKSGWSIKTCFNRIETALGDYYGISYKNEVMKRLKFYVTVA